MTVEICSPCWFHDCKNCTGRDCWHAERGEHYKDEDDDGPADPSWKVET